MGNFFFLSSVVLNMLQTHVCPVFSKVSGKKNVRNSVKLKSLDDNNIQKDPAEDEAGSDSCHKTHKESLRILKVETFLLSQTTVNFVRCKILSWKDLRGQKMGLIGQVVQELV